MDHWDLKTRVSPEFIKFDMVTKVNSTSNENLSTFAWITGGRIQQMLRKQF